MSFKDEIKSIFHYFERVSSFWKSFFFMEVEGLNEKTLKSLYHKLNEKHLCVFICLFNIHFG